MNDCLFCQIIKGEISSQIIYEDELTYAFLDITPVNSGHTLVVPKKHSVNILDTEEKDICALASVVKKIAPKIIKAVGAAAFNLAVNNGSDAGQVVPHLHFHIMPRFPDDRHKLWSGVSMRSDELAKVAEKIRKEL